MDGASPQIDKQRYSIPELLHSRHSLPVLSCVVPKLNKHPDIAAIVRIPEEALRNPDKYTCKSNTLLNFAASQKSASIERRSAGGRSSGESEYQAFPRSNMGEYAQNLQWYLRQHDHSDHSNQPYSAPTGLAAQQLENFQRFYRAVVSPTHVRVTAGGRIVPNTKATASSELGWNGDKFCFEPPNPLLSIENQNISPSIPWPNLSTLPIAFPGPPSASSYSQYNFLPQLGIPDFTTVTAQAPLESRGFDQTSYESTHSSYITAETPSDSSISKQSIPSQNSITISPPTQFDHSKPFMYNGQWVYPVPPGFHPAPSNSLPLPVTMLGSPNFAQPLQTMPANNFSATHGPTPLNAFNQSLGMLANIHPLPMLMPNIQPVPLPALVPALLSIFDMTEFHVQSLRDNLKFIENQLVNNRHQIDEGYMQAQRQAIMVQIDKLERMLQSQMAQENRDISFSFESRTAMKPVANAAIAAGGKKPETAVGRGIPVRITEPKPEVVASKGSKQQLIKIEAGSTDKTKDAAQDFGGLVKPQPSTSKSRLTAAAARAPEFQPRAQALAATTPKQSSNGNPVIVQSSLPTHDPSESNSQIEARLLSRSSDDWTPSSDTGSGFVTSRASLLKSHSMEVPSSSQINHLPSLPHYNTFHGQLATVLPAFVPALQTQPIPYLVGVLPQHVQVDEAKATDLVYPRPLTNEELRARYLYWGKAPRSAQRGLPKFDGKDFYPPSPQKGPNRFVYSTPSSESAFRRDNWPISTDLETLFTDSSGAGYSTPSPLRHATSLQSILPAAGSSIFSTKRTILGVHRKNASSDFLRSALNGPSSATFVPSTTLSGVVADSETTRSDDFSQLFMERGVPGYRSPPPISQRTQKHIDVTLNKRGTMVGGSELGGKDFEHNMSVGSPSNDVESISSSVEIHLTTQAKRDTAQISREPSFSERVAKISSAEQQTQFLHNMLRNTTQTTLAAPALSGTVSSTTAHGYLPPYRGTAAASLAPAMHNLSSSDPEAEGPTAKEKASPHPTTSFAPLIAFNFLPENRPLNRDRVPRSIHPLLESMTAESYMRSLTRKADGDKMAQDQGWKDEVIGTGPVIGSNW